MVRSQVAPMKSALNSLQHVLVVITTLTVVMTFDGHIVAKSELDTLGGDSSEPTQIINTATSESALPSRIEDLKIPDEPFARNAAIASWILELDEQKVSDWLSQSTTTTWEVSQRTRVLIQSLLARRLTTSDPTQALEFALARVEPVRSTLLKAVLDEWATRDLNATIEQVKNLNFWAHRRLNLLENIFAVNGELSDDEEQKILQDFRDEENLTNYFLGLQRIRQVVNPKAEWYQTLKVAHTQPKVYEDLIPIAQAWIGKSGGSVLDEINNSIKNYGIRKQVLTRTLTSLAASEPEQALDYLVRNDLPNEHQILNDIVYTWAKYGDAIEALKTVHALPDSQLRKELENRIALIWMGVDLYSHFGDDLHSDPMILLNNLDQVPPTLRGEISGTAIGRLVWSESPSQAVEQVLLLDPELQLNAAKVLVAEWIRKDQSSCIEWVLSNPDSESLRNKLYHTVSWRLLDLEELELAFQLARKQPIPDHGFGLEGDLFADIATRDLKLAQELLPNVREGKTMVTAYVGIGTEMLRRGKREEVIKLGTELPTNDRLLYYTRVSFPWAQSNPAGLLNAIEEFPSAAIRSYVALTHIYWNNSTNYFTTEQLKVLEQHLGKSERQYLEENR